MPVLITSLFAHRSASPRSLLSPFLRAQRKVTQRRHPTKILHGVLGRPQYISETRPTGSDSPKCLTLGLGRTPKFSNGSKATKTWLYPKPARPRSGPYDIFGHPSWPKEASRKGERVALPAPSVYEWNRECRASEAAGRVCAGKRTWP